jgi:hypothetical protein
LKLLQQKLFSHSILESGTGSKLWKFDFEDVYKMFQ